MRGARQIRAAVPEAVHVFRPTAATWCSGWSGGGALATAAEVDDVVVNDDHAAVEDVNAVLEGRPGAMRPHPPLERMTEQVRAEIERHLDASV